MHEIYIYDLLWRSAVDAYSPAPLQNDRTMCVRYYLGVVRSLFNMNKSQSPNIVVQPAFTVEMFHSICFLSQIQPFYDHSSNVSEHVAIGGTKVRPTTCHNLSPTVNPRALDHTRAETATTRVTTSCRRSLNQSVRVLVRVEFVSSSTNFSRTLHRMVPYVCDMRYISARGSGSVYSDD